MSSPVGVHQHGRGIRYKGNHGDGEYEALRLIRTAHSNTAILWEEKGVRKKGKNESVSLAV